MAEKRALACLGENTLQVLTEDVTNPLMTNLEEMKGRAK